MYDILRKAYVTQYHRHKLKRRLVGLVPHPYPYPYPQP